MSGIRQMIFSKKNMQSQKSLKTPTENTFNVRKRKTSA